MRDDPAYEPVKIIVSSAKNFESDQQACLELGADAYLVEAGRPRRIERDHPQAAHGGGHGPVLGHARQHRAPRPRHAQVRRQHAVRHRRDEPRTACSYSTPAPASSTSAGRFCQREPLQVQSLHLAPPLGSHPGPAVFPAALPAGQRDGDPRHLAREAEPARSDQRADEQPLFPGDHQGVRLARLFRRARRRATTRSSICR